jgi:hypothetical protein
MAGSFRPANGPEAARIVPLGGLKARRGYVIVAVPPSRPLRIMAGGAAAGFGALARARRDHALHPVVWFTGLLPYRVGHVRGVLVARRTADLRYDLLLTRPGRRGGRPLGHVAGGPERASGDVRFDPIRNAAPDLRQGAGPLDAVRARSYAASREGSTAGRR